MIMFLFIIALISATLLITLSLAYLDKYTHKTESTQSDKDHLYKILPKPAEIKNNNSKINLIKQNIENTNKITNNQQIIYTNNQFINKYIKETKEKNKTNPNKQNNKDIEILKQEILIKKESQKISQDLDDLITQFDKELNKTTTK
jgi:hypothetical protein